MEPSTDPLKDPLKIARHNLRGRLNSVKMCVFALETMHPHEAIEFLEMIERGADNAVVAVDELEAAFQSNASAGAAAAAADQVSGR